MRNFWMLCPITNCPGVAHFCWFFASCMAVILIWFRSHEKSTNILRNIEKIGEIIIHSVRGLGSSLVINAFLQRGKYILFIITVSPESLETAAARYPVGTMSLQWMISSNSKLTCKVNAANIECNFKVSWSIRWKSVEGTVVYMVLEKPRSSL